MDSLRKALVGGALAATALAGGALGAALTSGSAGAATNPTTASSASTQTAPPTSGYGTPQGQPPQGQPPQGQGQNQQGQRPQGQFDPSKGGHQANGKTEALLTGTQKSKAEAAAKAKVPGATVQRSETDAEGAAYEVHLQKSDGSLVTVKLDASFTVTSVEQGPA